MTIRAPIGRVLELNSVAFHLSIVSNSDVYVYKRNKRSFSNKRPPLSSALGIKSRHYRLTANSKLFNPILNLSKILVQIVFVTCAH